jgi:hypothetical protein
LSLLRASGAALGLEVDIDAVTDPDAAGDAGVPHGEVLLGFATAVQRRDPDLAPRREAVRRAVGDGGLVEAAATISAFNGLVRVADGTGIPLDDGVLAYSADIRQRLGIDRFAGAENSRGRAPLAETPDGAEVRQLFR